MMITVQTNYEELVSKPNQKLQSELAGGEIELKTMNIHTARGGE